MTGAKWFHGNAIFLANAVKEPRMPVRRAGPVDCVYRCEEAEQPSERVGRVRSNGDSPAVSGTDYHLVIVKQGENALASPPRVPLDSVRQLLGECSLFRGLDVPDRNELVSRARVRSFAAGDTVFLMGSAGDCLMAVLSGRVRISMTSPDGKEIVLAMLEPGEFFGEIALLDGRDRTADATAMTACSLAILERRDILAFLEHHPSAWLRIVEVLCARLRNTDQHIAEIALLGLPARLAKAVLRLLNTGDSAPARPSQQIQLSQRALGNMVGASRESINKCLGDWQRRGIVQVDGMVISVTDKKALERVADLG